MTKVYEVIILLYEGETQSLGIYSTLEKAETAKAEALEDWASGPNVETLEINVRIVD